MLDDIAMGVYVLKYIQFQEALGQKTLYILASTVAKLAFSFALQEVAVQSLQSERREGARFFSRLPYPKGEYVGLHRRLCPKVYPIPGSTWSKNPLYFGINSCKTCFQPRKKWQFRVCRVRRERGQDFFQTLHIKCKFGLHISRVDLIEKPSQPYITKFGPRSKRTTCIETIHFVIIYVHV